MGRTRTLQPAKPAGTEFWKRELGFDAEVRIGDESGLKIASLARTLIGQGLCWDNEALSAAVSSARSCCGTSEESPAGV